MDKSQVISLANVELDKNDFLHPIACPQHMHRSHTHTFAQFTVE